MDFARPPFRHDFQQRRHCAGAAAIPIKEWRKDVSAPGPTTRRPQLGELCEHRRADSAEDRNRGKGLRFEIRPIADVISQRVQRLTRMLLRSLSRLVAECSIEKTIQKIRCVQNVFVPA